MTGSGVGEPVPQSAEALTALVCELVVKGELGGSPLAEGLAHSGRFAVAWEPDSSPTGRWHAAIHGWT